jgi:hypothetical protein
MLGLEQQHRALVRIECRPVIVGKDRNDLRSDCLWSAEVGRHDGKCALAVGKAEDLTERQDRVARRERSQRRLHDVDAVAHRQQVLDVRVTEDEDVHDCGVQGPGS